MQLQGKQIGILIGITCILLAVFCCPPVSAQDKELGELIERLSRSIRKRSSSPRVVIFPFPFQEEVAAGLIKNRAAAEIVDFQALKKVFDDNGFELRHLATPYVVNWIARDLRADVVITHAISISHETVNIRIGAMDPQKQKKIAEEEVKLAKTLELVKRLSDWRSPLTIASATITPAREPTAARPGLYQSGRDGIGVPKCVRCPNPDFTREAIDAKFDGKLVFRVVVDVDGRITEIVTVK